MTTDEQIIKNELAALVADPKLVNRDQLTTLYLLQKVYADQYFAPAKKLRITLGILLAPANNEAVDRAGAYILRLVTEPDTACEILTEGKLFALTNVGAHCAAQRKTAGQAVLDLLGSDETDHLNWIYRVYLSHFALVSLKSSDTSDPRAIERWSCEIYRLKSLDVEVALKSVDDEIKQAIRKDYPRQVRALAHFRQTITGRSSLWAPTTGPV